MKPIAPTGVAVTRLARIRVASVLAAAGLPNDTPLERMSSVTNEVWRTPDFIIRVNRKPDGRLRREAFLSRHLPADISYPEVMAVSSSRDSDWVITKRIPGRPLSRAWPSMADAQRRKAIEQIGSMLQSLHQTEFPTNIAMLVEPPQLIDPGFHNPTARLDAALVKLRKLANVDVELVEAIARQIRTLAPALQGVDASTFVHGDLTFENVMWDGSKVSALIDFEWSRPGPADLDLDILLRLSAYPFLHVAEDYEHETLAADYECIPKILEACYPELWDCEGVVDRLVLYAIAYDVRALLRFPPKAHASRLSEHHPVNRLRRTLAGTSHVHEFLSAGFSL